METKKIPSRKQTSLLSNRHGSFLPVAQLNPPPPIHIRILVDPVPSTHKMQSLSKMASQINEGRALHNHFHSSDVFIFIAPLVRKLYPRPPQGTMQAWYRNFSGKGGKKSFQLIWNEIGLILFRRCPSSGRCIA
ncbi:hypothetical protein CDAR_84211 [Caerostris darwini]|uniref:Uncharacterized protein n=1 Tax=Caerostris darwini TaxID=1538125 RepID=A0AAV4U695_9ARAC|nr:hypothetical protein CDAR_84211 [Caerostris darwini]